MVGLGVLTVGVLRVEEALRLKEIPQLSHTVMLATAQSDSLSYLTVARLLLLYLAKLTTIAKPHTSTS